MEFDSPVSLARCRNRSAGAGKGTQRCTALLGRNCAFGQAVTQLTSPARRDNPGALMCLVVNSSLLPQGWCLRQAKQQAASWAPGASHSYTKPQAIPAARGNPKCCSIHTTEQAQGVPWDSEESSWLCLGGCRLWTLPVCIQFWYRGYMQK